MVAVFGNRPEVLQLQQVAGAEHVPEVADPYRRFGKVFRKSFRPDPFVSVLPFESSDRQRISLCAHYGVDPRSSTTTTVVHPELFKALRVIPYQS